MPSGGRCLRRFFIHLQILAFCFLGKREKQPSCSLILAEVGASVCKTCLLNSSKKGPSSPNLLLPASVQAGSPSCPPLSSTTLLPKSGVGPAVLGFGLSKARPASNLFAAEASLGPAGQEGHPYLPLQSPTSTPISRCHTLSSHPHPPPPLHS